jgi:hypothetical protein
MASHLSYCSVRYGLEERGWILASGLSAVTSRLMKLVGKDHQRFLATQRECKDIQSKIAASRKDLQKHRALHNC